MPIFVAAVAAVFAVAFVGLVAFEAGLRVRPSLRGVALS
jgi:hypothetical protein